MLRGLFSRDLDPLDPANEMIPTISYPPGHPRGLNPRSTLSRRPNPKPREHKGYERSAFVSRAVRSDYLEIGPVLSLQYPVLGFVPRSLVRRHKNGLPVCSTLCRACLGLKWHGLPVSPLAALLCHCSSLLRDYFHPLIVCGFAGFGFYSPRTLSSPGYALPSASSST